MEEVVQQLVLITHSPSLSDSSALKLALKASLPWQIIASTWALNLSISISVFISSFLSRATILLASASSRKLLKSLLLSILFSDSWFLISLGEDDDEEIDGMPWLLCRLLRWVDELELVSEPPGLEVVQGSGPKFGLSSLLVVESWNSASDVFDSEG